jgi:imidazole glycerol phosphate synthase subunit HisF
MRAALTAIPMILVATAAFAQDTATLRNLAACRSVAETVDLSFTYTGGVCEATDPATVTVDGTAARVTVPTHATAEMCTLQAVDIDVAQTIEAGAGVTTLDVELLNTQGQVAGTGKVEIEPQCAG